jgi:hypothetical protein
MVDARRRIAREQEIAKARAVLEKYGYRVIEPSDDESVKAPDNAA